MTLILNRLLRRNWDRLSLFVSRKELFVGWYEQKTCIILDIGGPCRETMRGQVTVGAIFEANPGCIDTFSFYSSGMEGGSG